MLMTSCFVCMTLYVGRKWSTGGNLSLVQMCCGCDTNNIVRFFCFFIGGGVLHFNRSANFFHYFTCILICIFFDLF